MKLITWNCNGAFRKKYHLLEQHDADLLIIQECEDPARSTQAYQDWAGNHLWIGGNKNRGLGIFARKGIKLSPLPWPAEDLELFLPCRIDDRFNLLAVWTKQANSPTFQYIGQFWKYLRQNKAEIAFEDILICGDFNSNVIWDKWDRWWNHSNVIEELEELGIQSVYHKITEERQGQESKPTFYLHRNLEKPYHIDYVFSSEVLLNQEKGALELGSPEEWLGASDHLPMIYISKIK